MLILKEYPRLEDELANLPALHPICKHGSIIESELCEIFISECGDALRYEIYQGVLDTDEITSLLIGFHQSASTTELMAHVEHVVFEEAAMYINGMVGQVEKNGGS